MTILGIAFVMLLAFHVGFSLASARNKSGSTGSASVTTLIMDLAPFVVLCCSGRKRGSKKALFSAYLQVLVFGIACYFGHREGVFSRELISPIHIGIGLLAGHLIFGASLLVTQRSLRAAASHFVDFHALWDFAVENPSVLMQFASVSVAEEMIYRVSLQPLLMAYVGNAVIGIVLVAIVFSCVHEHFFRNELLQSAEFMGFALLLGVMYWWTHSLILVIVIHAVRNIEIAFLEYIIRLDETGDEEVAGRESEFLSGERLAVFVTAPSCGMEVAYFEHTTWSEPEAVAGAKNAPATPIQARLNLERS